MGIVQCLSINSLHLLRSTASSLSCCLSLRPYSRFSLVYLWLLYPHVHNSYILFTLSITASENARHASTTISMNIYNVVDLAGVSAALARGRLQLPYRYINIHHCLQDTTMNNHQCQWAVLISIHHRHQRGWIMMSLSSSSLPTVTQYNAITRCYDHRLPY